MLIDQAIFTSAQTRAAAGYQLLAVSPGVTAGEAQELSIWGPSHDSLIDHGPSAYSINFHPLKSGRFAVSKTTTAGNEYSGRSGPRIYTHFLILTAADLARFANNPFSVVRAATAHGRMQPCEHLAATLEPLRLAGKSPPVDYALLNELVSAHGAARLAAWIDAVLTANSTVLVADRDRTQLIAGVLNCLPVDCRIGYSFTTGLKPSPARTFRIQCHWPQSADLRRIQRDPSLGTFYLADEPQRPPQSSWARYVLDILGSGKSYSLASQLSVGRGKLTRAQLDDLAEHLQAQRQSENGPSASEPAECFPRLALETVPASGPGQREPTSGPVRRDRSAACNPSLVLHTEENDSTMLRGSQSPSLPQPESARQGGSGLPKSSQNESCRSSAPRAAVGSAELAMLIAQSPDARAAPGQSRSLEALELLDDTVFAAIAGSEPALVRLRKLWPSTLAKLGSAELAESREHYIRRALAAWREVNEASGCHDPRRALHAIEVVCTLMGE